jgi:UDP-glucose 4-epimerase
MVQRGCAASRSIYGDGTWLRDYVYVEDVARAFVLAAAKFRDRSRHTWSAGVAAPRRGVTRCCQVGECRTGRQVKVEHVDSRRRRD